MATVAFFCLDRAKAAFGTVQLRTVAAVLRALAGHFFVIKSKQNDRKHMQNLGDSYSLCCLTFI